MTPEERAAAFVREHRGFDSNGDVWFLACDRAEANLASAIREAEDAALERAAIELSTREFQCRMVDITVNGQRVKEADGCEQFIPKTEMPGLFTSVRKAVRDLKHKD